MPWGQIAGAVIGGMMARQGAKKQNTENRIASAKQMAFQREMSNTAYQRGMNDMQQAGLNPILAGKMGGASTPGGATYQAQNANLAGIQASANVANVIANTNKTNEETKILKDTAGSALPKTIEGFMRLIKENASSAADMLNKKLRESAKINAMKKKKIPIGKTYKIPKVAKQKTQKLKRQPQWEIIGEL